MRSLALALTLLVACAANAAAQHAPDRAALARWQRTAARVTIVRDDWGIAHVHGASDADAVFGAMYAQAEDDFNRIETNYLNAMGRLAEAEGEREIFRDLRMKLFIDPDTLKAQYAASPEWLRALMVGFADGLNFYLYSHPDVHPRVLTHFEPWMALSFSEGSIGGDIETIDIGRLRALYDSSAARPVSARGAEGARGDGGAPEEPLLPEREPSGSNGIAIAPKNTIAKRALLLINPHTSFFFRSELQMTSDEGLDAYGASTWGQFFIYQGFNPRIGWMHTSSTVDAIDEYRETIVRRGGALFYRYAGAERPLVSQRIVVPYHTANGLARRTFTVYRTHHGPIVRAMDSAWVSVRLMQAPVQALTQSYQRTKARSYAEFARTMELHTNSSNNTVYADADGHIAYFHANFIPTRDARFDWTKPVDGSDPATEWGAPLAVSASPNLLDPPNGWLYNTNNAPWTAAGDASPKRADYPAYVDAGGQNARGVHAIRLLSNRTDFSIEALRAAAFDSYLPAFAATIPLLVASYDSLPPASPLRAQLAEQIAALRAWDFRWSASSVPTSLAVFWGEEMGRRQASAARRAGLPPDDEDAMPHGAQQLEALASASQQLVRDFGTWKTPWGSINRFQRLTGDIVQPFTDAGASIPVPFTSSRWGSLASFGARPYPNTKKWYGTSGNSFVAVVEFGDSVRAIAVTAGGESGHPSSPHFDDEATRYASGNLRPVYFYPSQLVGHTERRYHPGSETH